MVKEKILLHVDDEPEHLNLVESILKKENFKIIKAQNGHEVLKLLRKKKPDLLLLDFFMPGMSGRELCERIRFDNRIKDLKIAFLTVAMFSKKGNEELKRLNVLDCIQKPFQYKDFVHRIKKIIA